MFGRGVCAIHHHTNEAMKLRYLLCILDIFFFSRLFLFVLGIFSWLGLDLAVMFWAGVGDTGEMGRDPDFLLISFFFSPKALDLGLFGCRCRDGVVVPFAEEALWRSVAASGLEPDGHIVSWEEKNGKKKEEGLARILPGIIRLAARQTGLF